jgi:hypothetical protein
LLNITVIGRIIYNITQFNLSKEHAQTIGVIFAIIFLGLGYFGLYKKRDGIFQMMSQLSEKRRQVGKNIFIAYIIVSSILFCIVTIFFFNV